MKNQISKRKKRNRYFPVLLAVGVILVYAFFAYPLYTQMKIGILKAAFQDIKEMELEALEDEDEEILQDYYRDERIEITIADEDRKVVYRNHAKSSVTDSEEYITENQKEYSDQPEVYIRSNHFQRLLRLRGLVRRATGTGQEKLYYVYIRKEIRSVGEVIHFTTIYFGTMLLLLTAVWCLQIRRRKEESAETEAYLAESGASDLLPGNYLQETEDDVDSISQGDLAKVQREFVANVSHELKTPLAVISGQVEMLQSMGDEIDREYYFSSIREEITKMSDMVGNLLNLTSMEHHMEEMKLTEMNVSDMMEYMILKYAALFRQNGIRLYTDVEKECIISGNQMYLERAVNNYIMNAFQHTAQGQEIRICLKKENDQAVIRVYNEGQQISEEDMEHIWQGFYKRSEERKYRGSLKLENAGLGLFLVKKIVDHHHGSCGVQNLEHGVEFWIRVHLIGE